MSRPHLCLAATTYMGTRRLFGASFFSGAEALEIRVPPGRGSIQGTGRPHTCDHMCHDTTPVRCSYRLLPHPSILHTHACRVMYDRSTLLWQLLLRVLERVKAAGVAKDP